jgi:rare lipoprotein A
MLTAVTIGVGLALVLTAALPVLAQSPAVAPTLKSAPRPVAPHERASTWRTIIIPISMVPTPSPAPRPALRPGVVTASLPPSAPAAKPLIGFAHQTTGLASYYWQDQMTSSGERFNRRDLTAAHRTLPMNTKVRVTHVASGRQVVVRINDRGPFKAGRVIDLSEAAAEQLQIKAVGLAQVRLDVVR